MPTYLVTGGAGFIGSSIAEALLARGETVRVLDDFSSGRRVNLETLPNKGGKLEVTEGTILDPDTVTRCMRGVDVVFHEAAIPSVVRSVEDPQRTTLANVQGTTVVLDIARKEKVKRVIYAASSSAYGNTKTLPKVETMTPSPLSPYAIAKHAGEQMMRVFASLYGIETLSLRYFNVFGPRQDRKSQYAAVIPNFISAALSGQRPIVFGDGEQTRDFCFIDNVVRANLLAADSPNPLRGEVVNIACGERTSLNALVKYVAEEVGVRLDIDYRPERAGDVRDSLADTSAARALIGYEPLVDIREGLRRTIAAFRATQA
ncbi:SDR family oxidoreductase [Pendulispora albinea]|uniref:SDR family oxidoreductase n=1 Tax=Pendulispora albinea TaxID=2741071 RepID=A0ABZ2M0N0_9BACT